MSNPSGISINSSNANYSINVSAGGISATLAQSMSYSDISVAANFRRATHEVYWDFNYAFDSQVAKNSYTVRPKTMMTNSIGRFYFERSFIVDFYYAFDVVSAPNYLMCSQGTYTRPITSMSCDDIASDPSGSF